MSIKADPMTTNTADVLPEDVLAALTDAIEGQNLYHGRHGTTPAGRTTAMAIRSGLAARHISLVDTAELERLRAVEAAVERIVGNGKAWAREYAFEVLAAALTAKPSPSEGEE